MVGALLEVDGAFDSVLDSVQRLEDATKSTAERFADLTKDSATFKGQLVAIATTSHTLSEALVLVTRHLQNLHDATATFSSLGPVLAAVNAQLEAQKRILGGVNDPRTGFVRDMTALNMLFKNGKIDAADYVTQQAKMATGFATHEGVVVKVAKAYEALAENQRRVFGNMAILTSSSDRNIAVPQFQPAAQEWNIGSNQPGADATRSIDVERDMMNARAGQAQAQYEWTKKTAEEAKKLEESTVKISDIFAAELVGSAQTFSDSLVDAANGADVSWTSTFESMATGLQKAIVQALILKAITGSYSGAAGASGYGGLLGLAGFASGGTIFPSGGGTADTQTVAFRKRPDETVHINTPQQERAYQGSQSGGGRTQTVNVRADDHRALLQGFDGPDGDRVVLNVMRRNPGAVAALIPRR